MSKQPDQQAPPAPHPPAVADPISQTSSAQTSSAQTTAAQTSSAENSSPQTSAAQTPSSLPPAPPPPPQPPPPSSPPPLDRATETTRRLQAAARAREDARAATGAAALVAASGAVTYADAEGHALGCKHYRRRCKLWSEEVGAFVTCRLCFEEEVGHAMDRHAVERVLCMVCGVAQGVSRRCATEGCGAAEGAGFAAYFCEVCRLYDDSGAEVYHCEECGICRLGRREDNFHCAVCDACVAMESRDRHRCMPHSLSADCPVCCEKLFTSRAPVCYMRCGHAMHNACWDKYTRLKYTCPICCAALTDMTAYYAALDAVMEAERAAMPAELRERTSKIMCHDCRGVSVAPFHFQHHKCERRLQEGGEEGGRTCGSYNTRVI